MIKDPASLEPQIAIIPLRQGLDLKTAVQVVDPPAMLALSNVTLHAPGEIAKDRGYNFLPATDLAAVALPTPLRRFVEHSSAQMIVGRDNLAERSETADAFHAPPNRTAIASSSARRSLALDSNAAPLVADYAALADGSYEIHAVIHNNNILRIRVQEIQTGAVVSSLAVAVTPVNGQQPRCLAYSDGRMFCIWADGANLRVSRWNGATAGLGAPVNLAVNVNAGTKHIDAVVSNSTVYVAYTTTTPTVSVLRFATNNLAVAGTAGVAGTALAGVALCLDGADNQLVAWCGAPGLSVFGLTPAGAARGNSVLSAVAHERPACISNENATTRGTVFAVNAAAGLATARHQCAFTGAGGSLATASLFGWDIAHKPVLIDQLIFIGYAWNNGGFADTENTVATVVHRADNGQVSTADPVCWYLYGQAAVAVALPPSSVTLVNGEYRWAWPIIDPSETTLESRAVALLSLRPYVGASVPFSSGAYLCNALTNGQTGFFDASHGNSPAIRSPTQQNVGAGLVPGATYTYIAYYDLLLPDGTRVVSLTSDVEAVTITGLNDQVTFLVNTPLFREGLTCVVRVARTLANGSVFHVLNQSVAADARTAATITFVDGDADTNVAAYPLVYTSGGVLDAYPQPMTGVLCLHQGRAFGIDENSNQLRYTREILPGEAPAWNPVLAVGCNGSNLSPRALITSPSGLWVLGRDRQTGAGAIALLLGTGPADNGDGSTYELQRLENCDVGPDGFRKAVSTPTGILFEDPNQGFHLLPTGGGQPVFVGAPIEAQRRAVVCMHVLTDRKEVRVTQNGGVPNLSWHYDQNQWSTRGLPSAVTILDATIWDGRHVLLASFAMARQENGFFGDPLAGYQVTSLTTAWIKSSGFSGLQRIWRLYLLGRNIAPHGLTVTLQYDYNDTAPGDVYTFTEADVAAAVASGKYEFRISPRKQLCEAFRVTIADTAGSSGNGQGAAWTALRLEYGALRGSSRKVGAARKS